MKKSIYPPIRFANGHLVALRDWCDTNKKDIDTLNEDDLSQFNTDFLKSITMMQTFGELSKTFDPMMQIAATYVAYRWRMNKQVYTFSEDFAKILNETPLDFVLEPSMFEHMPYRTFAVEWGNNYGFATLYSAIDPDTDELVQELFIVALDDVAEGESGTTSTIVYKFNDKKHPDWTPERLFKDFRTDAERERLSTVLQMTLYLAAENSIVEENPEQKTIYRRPKGRVKDRYGEVRKWDAGIRRNKLTRNSVPSNNASEDNGHAEGSSHRSPREHWRKAHWHRYRTGKGRTQTVLRWVQPTLVNPGGKNADSPVVITDTGK